MAGIHSEYSKFRGHEKERYEITHGLREGISIEIAPRKRSTHSLSTVMGVSTVIVLPRKTARTLAAAKPNPTNCAWSPLTRPLFEMLACLEFAVPWDVVYVPISEAQSQSYRWE